jgi:hypothetical protein
MGEKETGGSDEAERLKTKTKGNQSNDIAGEDEAGRWTVDATPPDTSAMAGSAGAGEPAEAAINNSHSNIKNLREAGDTGGGNPAEAAINNSHSNIKNLREAGDSGGGDPAEAAINTSHSNIKNLREDGEITADDSWEAHGSKLAPDNPGKSEIAIGDPGVNGNIAGEPPGIAVSDEGVRAAKPQSQNR